MGAIDDVQTVMQDFLAPELRELRVRIDNVERHVEETIRARCRSSSSKLSGAPKDGMKT